MPDSKHPSGLTRSQLWHRYDRYPALLAKVALMTLIVLAIYTVFTMVEAVLVPVLTALTIAYLLDPLVDRFEERGWSRSTTIFGLLGFGLASLTLFVLFLYPTVRDQTVSISERLPALIVQVEQEVGPWVEDNLGVELPETWSQALAKYGGALRSQFTNLAGLATSGVQLLLGNLTGLAGSLINIVMIPVFTFYFLRDFDRMRLSTVDYIPEANREFFLERIRRMDEVVGAWFRGQVEVAFILGVLYALGLGFVFGWAGVGIGAGLAVGMMSGLLNIVPYVGFVIGFGVSVLMVLLEGSGIGPLLGVGAVFAIVQSLEGYVITPRIVGEKVGLSPVAVIIALLLGGEILGLVGILLAIPVAGILRVLWPDVMVLYRSSRFYTGDTDLSDTEDGSSPA